MRNWVRRPVSRCRGNGVGVCEVDFLCELLAWGLAFIIFWLVVRPSEIQKCLSVMRPGCFHYPHKSIKNIQVKFITPEDFLSSKSPKLPHMRSEEFIAFNHSFRDPSLSS